jgi:chitodextrinase
MGNSYYNNVTEWSKGEYPNANQTQDDVAIIQAKLGLKPDDHGNSIGAGTALVVGPTGTVVSSNPELDPHNVLPENKGVINSRTDVDVFTFVAGAGPLSLTVKPAWDAFYRATTRRGANLDIKLELRNAAGSLVTSNDPATDTMATISATVGAGTYHLLISGEGTGDLVTGYSDYDSLGQYFINGSMVSGASDGTAPTPNPMTWASLPAATSSSAIAMTATVATDETSSVQYNFQCLAGGSGCVNSGWRSSNSYTASGLAASTSYTFNVIARDVAGNQTSPAPSLSATTQPLAVDSTPPNPNPLTWASPPAAISSSAIAMTATVATDAVSSVQYNFQCLAGGSGCVNSGWQSSNSYTATGLAASTSYTFNVIARDVAGNQTSPAPSLGATTQAPPPPAPIVASSETLVAGTVNGTYTNTQSDDGTLESIAERDSSGKTSTRYSYLEHRWNFTLGSSQVVTLYANAWSGGSTDGDTFSFQYSLNGGGSWTTAFTVSSTSTGNIQSFAIPGAQNGTIIVRVIDTNRVAGHRERNTVLVDHLYLKP